MLGTIELYCAATRFVNAPCAATLAAWNRASNQTVCWIRHVRMEQMHGLGMPALPAQLNFISSSEKLSLGRHNITTSNETQDQRPLARTSVAASKR